VLSFFWVFQKKGISAKKVGSHTICRVQGVLLSCDQEEVPFHQDDRKATKKRRGRNVPIQKKKLGGMVKTPGKAHVPGFKKGLVGPGIRALSLWWKILI